MHTITPDNCVMSRKIYDELHVHEIMMNIKYVKAKFTGFDFKLFVRIVREFYDSVYYNINIVGDCSPTEAMSDSCLPQRLRLGSNQQNLQRTIKKIPIIIDSLIHK